jgi:hypothetical protein
VSRPKVDVAVPAIALRRAEAAAALGISLELFDREVRARVASMQIGSVTVYPVEELRAYLSLNATDNGPETP